MIAVPASQLTIGYWNCRALGAPLRMMAAFKQIDYRDKHYEVLRTEHGGFQCPEWEEDKALLLGHNPFAALPFIIDDSTVVSTAPASSDFLAIKLGLAGSNESERSRNQQALAVVYELRSDAARMLYAPTEVYEHGHRGHLERTTHRHYAKLDRWLEMHKTVYLTSDSPASADFELWELIDMHELWANGTGCKRPLAGFDKLSALYERVRALPQLKAYFESPAFLLPYNNKMAHFVETGSSWRNPKNSTAHVWS